MITHSIQNIQRVCFVGEVVFEEKKNKPSFFSDCRHLGHIFFCRCLQMWFADYRHFTSEKTNNT
ncbi:hypothetical protein HanXRQr2_Chr11g0504291 [Helianthus annuus]|uniref:Uncharacterized protein n=1 Tax=Helianthus annuus TaxID=4232 RepID=A0A9K3N143_HELAN|nr:hypothetical protein HanXRQr2_Chr11g0504291 [Helianthus annuus]